MFKAQKKLKKRVLIVFGSRAVCRIRDVRVQSNCESRNCCKFGNRLSLFRVSKNRLLSVFRLNCRITRKIITHVISIDLNDNTVVGRYCEFPWVWFRVVDVVVVVKDVGDGGWKAQENFNVPALVRRHCAPQNIHTTYDTTRTNII